MRLRLTIATDTSNDTQATGDTTADAAGTTAVTADTTSHKSNAATGSDTAQVDTDTGFASGISLQSSPVAVVVERRSQVETATHHRH